MFVDFGQLISIGKASRNQGFKREYHAKIGIPRSFDQKFNTNIEIVSQFLNLSQIVFISTLCS